MPINFSTSGDHALRHGIKVCVHGRSGAGKTVLCSTAPAPCIISGEKGTLSIAKQNVPIILIHTEADLTEVYNWIRSSPEARKFGTFCLDSVSEIAEKLLSEQKAKCKDPRAAYGEMQDRMAVQLRQFRDLEGPNIVFTSKSELREQPDGTVMYSPMMPGKTLSQGLAYYFDEFLYLGVKDGVAPDGKTYSFRYLQCVAEPMAEAKDRSGVLSSQEEPNLTKLFAKIRSSFGA